METEIDIKCVDLIPETKQTNYKIHDKFKKYNNIPNHIPFIINRHNNPHPGKKQRNLME